MRIRLVAGLGFTVKASRPIQIHSRNYLKYRMVLFQSYENNRGLPSAKAMKNLGQNTNINLHWLYNGEGEMVRPGNQAPMSNGEVEVDAESREAAVELRKIPASVLEQRFQALEDAIKKMKNTIDRQNMVKEIARLNNLFQILQNTIINENPPEVIQERRKCMHILESVMPSAEHVPPP